MCTVLHDKNENNTRLYTSFITKQINGIVDKGQTTIY